MPTGISAGVGDHPRLSAGVSDHPCFLTFYNYDSY